MQARQKHKADGKAANKRKRAQLKAAPEADTEARSLSCDGCEGTSVCRLRRSFGLCETKISCESASGARKNAAKEKACKKAEARQV